MKLKVLVISLAALLIGSAAKGQDFAIKTNLLYDATRTVNAGVEFPIAPKWTMDISGNYNGWSKQDSKARWRVLMVQPEARYWFCNRFAGHFVAINALAQKYNIGGINEFGGKLLGTDFNLLKNNRFQGLAAGVGLAYGYAIPLATHWNLELEAGLGYVHTWYDQYQCKSCGKQVADNETHNYFGPTKAAINVVYLF